MNRPPVIELGSDFEAARAKVVAFIATVPRPGKYPWVIRDEDTKDLDGFWLFSWSARSDYWPKRKWCPTAGNGPIAIRKSDGAMFMYHMLCPWDEFVKRVESGNLHPYGSRIDPQ